jgi:hypothetical protein
MHSRQRLKSPAFSKFFDPILCILRCDFDNLNPIVITCLLTRDLLAGWGNFVRLDEANPVYCG